MLAILHGKQPSETNCYEEFKTFVQHLYYKHKKIVLILDNASWHHATALAEYIKNRDIGFIFLPPYSPELDSVEQAWKKLKSILSLKIGNSLAELKKHIITAFDINNFLLNFTITYEFNYSRNQNSWKMTPWR